MFETRLIRIALCLALLLALGGCYRAAAPEPGASELASQGKRAFERQKWDKAINAYQKVKDRYPFSPYALTAEMKIADSLYLQENYQEAIVAYQEFERMHPRNEAVPYAVYMQGMSNYRMMLSKDREQAPTAEALRNFQRLLADYPDSPLGEQAKSRVTECQERLAAHELYVAKWYRRTGHSRSALNRLDYVLANYPGTQSAGRAQRLLSEVRREVVEAEARGEQPVELEPAPAPLQLGTEREQRRPVP
jgi:outer membrane protein assembly factor BamD